MIEQGLFKKYFVGRDGFYWWIGQIAPEASWRDNKNGIPDANNEKQPGFGERYKVRIMGHHTAVPSELSDDELPWATVMYPVTAGGGTGAASQNSNLRQGMFVFGFFMDGEDGQQPVIMGVVGTNSYTAVMKNVPDAKFIPFAGYSPEYGEQLATYARRADNSEGEVAPVAQEAQGEETQNDTVVDSVEGNTEVQDAATAESAEETETEIVIPKPSHCDPIPLFGLQLAMSNTIKDIEKLQSTLTDYRQAATKGVYDLKGEIEEKKALMKKQIMNSMKWVFDEMVINAERISNEINKLIQGMASASTNYLGGEGYKGLVDTAICIIISLIEAFAVYLEDLVESILDKVVNVATCFIENFVASALAQIDNFLTQVINELFSAVTGAIDTAFDLADSGLGLLTSITSFIQDIFSLLDCESDDGCKEYKQTQWNMLTGGEERESLGDIMNKVKDFSGQFDQVFDFTNGITDALENQFQFDLDGIFDIDGCDIGPLLCGPPAIVLHGGTGAGFAANPVLGDDGSLIAVDILSLGSDYDDGTYAKVVDPCGNGNGGVIIPFGGNSIQDWIDWLNGDDTGDGDDGLGVGDGQRGVTDPVWANVERVDGGGAGGASILSPIFADGPVFDGLIGPERLSITDPGLITGITTTSIGGLIDDTGGAGGSDVTPATSIVAPLFGDLSRISEPGGFPGSIGTDRLSLTSIFDPGVAATVTGVGIGTTISITDATRLAIESAGIGATVSISPVGFPTTFETGAGGTSIFDPSGYPQSVLAAISVGQTATPSATSSIVQNGIVGFLIKDTGAKYLRKPDGSLGGMNRTWAQANETKVLKPDGTYKKPAKPGTIIALEKGDVIETPPGSKVVTEPDDNGNGGGEEIVGGTSYKMKGPGFITAPDAETDEILGNEPISADGSYPVITYMMGIYVDVPGTGYSSEDEVVIVPSLGAKATLSVTPQGGIEGIKMTSNGEGFKRMPRAYIKSSKGVGARLLPQLGVNRVSAELVNEPSLADKIIQVTDVAGGY